MKFDELLFNYLGEMGKYQKIQFVLVCLPTLFNAMHSLSWTFAAVQVPFRCALDGESKYSEYWTNTSLIEDTGACFSEDGSEAPRSERGDPGVRCRFEQCRFANSSTCASWLFDSSTVKQTAIGRWDIVCQRGSIKAVVQSAYYGGQMAGSLIFGHLGDRFGRKKIFIVAIVLELCCGLIMSVAPTLWLYAIARAGTGFAHPGIFVIAVVMGTELLGPSNRRLASIACGFMFALGQVILGILAYNITDYTYLHVAIASPAVLFLSYWWLVPESARWLVSQKRFSDADVVLQKAARMNGTTLPAQWWTLLEQESPEKETKQEQVSRTHSFADLFRTPQMRKRTLIVFYLWPVVSMVYYGLSMKSDVFGGSLYINFIAGGFIEMPAQIAVYLLIDRIGRRNLLAAGYGTAGLCLISNLFLGESASTFVAILQLLVTKGAITATYTVIYTFSPELFPTVVRNTAMGCCSAIARVGAISASFIALWIVERFGKIFMIIPFGALCLGAAVLTLLMLPETMGKPLPETIEQVERSEAADSERDGVAEKQRDTPVATEMSSISA